MQTEHVLFLVLVAWAAAFWLASIINQKANETAEKVFWANYMQPLIYEQADASQAAERAAVEAYENAIAMLKKHGNRYIGKEDVFLWVWGADKDNTLPDFARWALLNVQRRANIYEAFRAQKAKNFHNTGNAQGAAYAFGNYPPFEDIGEKTIK